MTIPDIEAVTDEIAEVTLALAVWSAVHSASQSP